MKKLFLSLPWMSLIVLILTVSAGAVRPIEDFRAPSQVGGKVAEQLKVLDDASTVQGTDQPTNPDEQERAAEVEQIRELLRLDELDRQNTMREALRQENLEDRVQGHEDLELAMAEKNADVHLGKVLTDMHGNRVRMEEYVLRPADNQVQFLNLSLRDNRVDYIDYNAYFNTTVPENPHGLWRKEFGRVRPDVYLTSESILFSNFQDSVNVAIGYFEPTWVAEMQKYYLPARESALQVNGSLKLGYERPTPDVDFTEKPDAVGLKPGASSFAFSDRNVLAYQLRLVFNDDTFLQLDKYLIDENGNVLVLRWDDFNDWYYWLTHLEELVFNSYKETIWTATEFEGRTIDTVSQFLRLVDALADDDRGWR